MNPPLNLPHPSGIAQKPMDPYTIISKNIISSPKPTHGDTSAEHEHQSPPRSHNHNQHQHQHHNHQNSNTHINESIRLISLKYNLGKLFHEHFSSTQSIIFNNTLLMQYCLVLMEKFKAEEDQTIIVYIKNTVDIFLSTTTYSRKSIEDVLIFCNNYKLLEHFYFFFTNKS